MYKVEVDYAPAYEFITSLYFYINKNRLKIYELGSDWKKEVDRRLGASFKRALEDHRLEVLHRVNLLVHKCPGERTPEEFIQWFKEMSPAEMYDAMLPWVQTIPKDMVDLHEQFVYLFTEWNEQYFKHLPPSILTTLERDAGEKRELEGTMDSADLVELSTNGIRIEAERVQKILLVPQYHYSPSSVIDYYEGYITCLYPVELEGESPYISQRTIHLFSSLSDQNRIYILKKLYEKPCSFKELVEFTQLTKSNLHYHLAMLRSAGLIRAHHSSERVESYSLRLGALSTLEDKLLSYIRGDV
jgi:DNA-binding transcriptional ArsR family regulator